MKLNAAQEYLTEGFQEYLGQVADNYIDKYTHGEEFTTVDNISRMAKAYIDVYKNLPSKQSVQSIRDLQNKIFFGKIKNIKINYIKDINKHEKTQLSIMMLTIISIGTNPKYIVSKNNIITNYLIRKINYNKININ